MPQEKKVDEGRFTLAVCPFIRPRSQKKLTTPLTNKKKKSTMQSPSASFSQGKPSITLNPRLEDEFPVLVSHTSNSNQQSALSRIR